MTVYNKIMFFQHVAQTRDTKFNQNSSNSFGDKPSKWTILRPDRNNCAFTFEFSAKYAYAYRLHLNPT